MWRIADVLRAVADGATATVSVDFEPRDLWVGLFWKVQHWVRPPVLHVWVCPLPMVAIHLEVRR